MKKSLLLLGCLIAYMIGYPQYLNSDDIYGKSAEFRKELTGVSAYITPEMEEMYFLTGVASIDPRLDVRINWFGNVITLPLIFRKTAPAVRLFHIKDGQVDPVWDWLTGPVTPLGFSDLGFQQWECYYNAEINQYVNAMGNNPYRFFPQQVERLDGTFHSVGGNDLYDSHDAEYMIHKGDTLFFHAYPGEYSQIECIKASTGQELGRFSTLIEDTIQSKYGLLPCLDNRFLGTGLPEYYHTNSVDAIVWNGDTLLIGSSERHTNLIRFVWFVRQNDGSYLTSPAFRLGSNSDTFNQVICRNGDMNIEAGHDFRFIKKFNDSIVCSYFDNHACSGGSKPLLFTLYPMTKEVVMLDSIRPIGDQTLASQGLGSARKILGNDKSYGAIKNAPWIVNWQADLIYLRDTLTFPGSPIIDTFYTAKRPMLDELGGGIGVIINSEKKFGLEFGASGPITFTPIFSGLTPVGLQTNIQASPVYRANAYLPGQLQFPAQPVIQSRSITGDSLELYVEDFQVQMWSTGDTTGTIIVPKASKEKYLVRGKTDSEMRGWLYSKPWFNQVTVLPTELVLFACSHGSDGPVISWETASEFNNNYFVVERSYDAAVFDSIGYVQGNGTTKVPHQYSFTDTISSNQSIYYRLRQVDYDGKVNYSDICFITLTGVKQNRITDWELFPNPTDGIIKINNVTGTVRVVDILGRNILTQEIDKQNNIISLEPFLSGMYMIEIQTKNSHISSKVIKR